MSSVRKLISEGAAKINLPEGQVFYNPVQIFNRDLSVVAINRYCESVSEKKELLLLEALSATGLRAVRYAHECPRISKIIANDIDPEAVKLINSNVINNSCAEKVFASCGDANYIMMKAVNDKQFYDIIDLDPYGSAAPFLDCAMQAINDGGLLCVTCTDMAALCATYTEACLAKYGSVPVKGDICHEFGVRIILENLERSASRFKKTIEPLMSCAIDFYSRIFVKVYKCGGQRMLKAPFQTGYLLRCPDCKNYRIQSIVRSLGKTPKSFKIGPSPLCSSENCSICNGNVQIAGPFWIGELHSKEFLDGINANAFPEYISTQTRITGLVEICKEECSLPPLYVSISELAHVLKAQTPSMGRIMSAIKNAGYNLCIPHSSPTAIKSNVPFTFILSIFYKLLLGTSYVFEDETEGLKSKIWKNFLASHLDEDIVSSISFETNMDAIPASKKNGFVRFPPNPEKNWGPKSRAKSVKMSE